MKFLVRIIGIISIFLCFAILACDGEGIKNNNNDNPPFIPPVISEQARVLETQTLEKIDSFNNANGTIVFTGLSQEEIPKVGEILVAEPSSNAPYGFLRRVTAVSNSGNRTTVNTTEAALTDVIKDGELNISDFDLDSLLDEPLFNYSNTGKVARNSNGVGLTYPIELDPFSKIPYLKDKISLEGEAKLNNSLDFKLKFEDSALQEMTVCLTTKSSLNLALVGEIETSDEDDLSFTLAELKLKPVIFNIGFVPIVIVPVIKLNLNFGLDVEIKGEITLIDADITVKSGIEYKDGEIIDIFDYSTNAKEPEATFTMRGEIKISLEPILEFRLYNNEDISVGISADLYGKIEFDAWGSNEGNDNHAIFSEYPILLTHNILNNTSLNGSIGADAKVAVKFKIFGLIIVDYKKEVKIFNKPIFEITVFPKLSEVTIKNTIPNYNNNSEITSYEVHLQASFTEPDNNFYSIWVPDNDCYGFFMYRYAWHLFYNYDLHNPGERTNAITIEQNVINMTIWVQPNEPIYIFPACRLPFGSGYYLDFFILGPYTEISLP